MSSGDINIGIGAEDRKAVAHGLSKLLADSYTLYLKTHNYHWNVTGKMFATLHNLFEEQYSELASAVDEIAERIRALGEFAPGSYSDYSELAQVKEAKGVPEALGMVQDLLESHETVARTARSVFSAAEKGNDEATIDLLTTRIQLHEKTAWMLRSLLG